MSKWEVRKGSWDPRSPFSTTRVPTATFSVAVAPAGSQAAAPFRVSGPTAKPEVVDQQAAVLVNWLNNTPEATTRSIHECDTGSGARVIITPAGRQMGFWR